MSSMVAKEEQYLVPPSYGSVNKPFNEEEEEEEEDTTTTTTEEGSSGGGSSSSSSHWELSFLFEAEQPSKRERHAFATPDESQTIEVVLDTADDEPGATQSGNYLWPAAETLARYLVQNYSSNNNYKNNNQQPAVVVELGAGNALVSIAAWQLWATSLQCLIVTDHDPSTLERARNNHETTLEELLDSHHCANEDDEFTTINNIGSIPTHFEQLDWNHGQYDVKYVQELIMEHSVPAQTKADTVLGSDLIYHASVVEPLFQTAVLLLMGGGVNDKKTNTTTASRGRFLLSQSFAYDGETELEIERCCHELGLTRTVLWEDQGGKNRILQFHFL
mmetsp:Transcript_6704/g.18780  ORF Transcript_6704/g.18780 Transcript_6704/m.18780 type:complete len:333 (+) Transcript_6704:219-1217(+)|eukprot:CAMPEP_0168742402 /NCGR_PEP_ID=MMETSP0724-20121128/13018_1 /TAXON_ID=265536 /ORGANISM="Amphiprora sp., Strain CCMP467" /LENGTH=332 /DNA_ID=CAMNT_0008789951 /DNA_START=167 /DNA_END=1165 /DNA_ORIENTATION=+